MTASGAELALERLRREDYAGAKALLARSLFPALASAWSGLKPMERMLLFKLMDAPLALEFFQSLPFEDKYFLFGGFSPQAIAPVLETADLARRRLFHSLPRESYERMCRGLVEAARG